MINQILAIAGPGSGPRRSIHLEEGRLDIEKVIDVISKGAAGSWQMENRHKTMNAGQYELWLCRRTWSARICDNRAK